MVNQKFHGYKWNVSYVGVLFQFWSLPIGLLDADIWAPISIGCLFRNNQLEGSKKTPT